MGAQGRPPKESTNRNPGGDGPSGPAAIGIDGFTFADLHDPLRLVELDRRFLDDLRAAEEPLAEALLTARQVTAANDGHPPLEALAQSELLIAVAPHLERFLMKIFPVESPVAALEARSEIDAVIFECRRFFLDRRVFKAIPEPESLAGADLAASEQAYREVVARWSVETPDDPEYEMGRIGVLLLEREGAMKAAGGPPFAALEADLEAVGRWATLLAHHPKFRATAGRWPIFFRPQKLDFEELVERRYDTPAVPTQFHGLPDHRRLRDGFAMTETRADPRRASCELHYCIICHERKKDSCSHGFPEGSPEGHDAPKLDGSFKRNPLGISLTGCPLGEKISEAHLLRRSGQPLGALAMVMVDNPLCPGTGHRICNDCMKGCIYQKQTPVNIPQAETNILADVLHLPYGFEIYSLLMRWNPLNLSRPVTLPYNGRNVLVVGMGPAGYTLAHHLLNDGFGVVAIDGLKIEPSPLPLDPFEPVREIGALLGPRRERTILGFGGVSEYGITARWDKRLLHVIHRALLVRDTFRLFDGIRFGGTLTIDDAWELGFDHIALATGAGRPTLLDARNSLIPGVRTASDFLMTLQGSGASRATGLAPLEIDLPALIIGGGLTAIDTCTETSAYYALQVERDLGRYEALVAERDDKAVRASFAPRELERLDRRLTHGRAIRAERILAGAEGRLPDFAPLLRSFGGVSIVYRKRLQDSPAYRLNHEEVVEALEQGIGFAECLDPKEFVPGDDGAVRAVRFERQESVEGRWRGTGEMIELPARSVMIAAGTHPNAVYEGEYPGTFALDNRGEYFAGHRLSAGDDGAFDLEPVAEGRVGTFTSYRKEGRFISFHGDNHPVYVGSVVKAMASARDGRRDIVRLFSRDLAGLDASGQGERNAAWERFASLLADRWSAEIVSTRRLTPAIVELVVRAPAAARRFRPGSFYRLQNDETGARVVDGHPLAMEGIAVGAASADPAAGTVTLIVAEAGASSRIAARLTPGEPVTLMGPTGMPTEIPEGETVLLAGSGYGLGILVGVARALSERKNRILWFAACDRADDLFYRGEIERLADRVVWCTASGTPIEATRAADRAFRGTLAGALEAYASGALEANDFPLHDVTRLITIGPPQAVASVQTARRTGLAAAFAPNAVAVGAVHAGMQCMMKEICARCLTAHIDPDSGRESIVYSCFQQDQPLDVVDFDRLRGRLGHDSTAERLADLWVGHLLARA